VRPDQRGYYAADEDPLDEPEDQSDEMDDPLSFVFPEDEHANYQ